MHWQCMVKGLWSGLAAPHALNMISGLGVHLKDMGEAV